MRTRKRETYEKMGKPRLVYRIKKIAALISACQSEMELINSVLDERKGRGNHSGVRVKRKSIEAYRANIAQREQN